METQTRKVIVATKLEANIRDLAKQVARAQGIEISEHVRSLIIKDLNERGLIDQRLKFLLNAQPSS